MPYTMDTLPKDVQDMPQHHREIFMAAFDAAWNGTCKDSDDREACAHKIAYAAVHKSQMSQNSALQEFSMAIVKATYNKGSGNMAFRMVASDTEEDDYGTHMSLSLFDEFIQSINENRPIPEQFSVFRESGWDGGMPYVSVAHYRSAGGKNVPGKFHKIYLDGNRLKATGEFFDTSLGRACFRSVCRDLYDQSDYEHKIRASIGFLDYKHSHGDFIFERKSLTDVCPKCEEGDSNKTFLSGQLIHIALTREPVNPRTDVEMEEYSMKSVMSKREDAESVVEDAIEEMSLEERSATASPIMQTRSDETVNQDAGGEEAPTIPEEVVETTSTPVIESPVSELDQAVHLLLSAVSTARSIHEPSEALGLIQPALNHVGEVIQREFVRPPSPEMVSVLQSLTALTEQISQISTGLNTLATDVAILKNDRPVSAPRQEIPAPRSVQLSQVTLDKMRSDSASNGNPVSKPKTQLEMLALKSVMGPGTIES